MRSLRVPRTIVGLLVGAALGAGGALMQGLTRNPFADPGILGVNAGAALFVVIGIYWFNLASLLELRVVRVHRRRPGVGDRLLARRARAARGRRP